MIYSYYNFLHNFIQVNNSTTSSFTISGPVSKTSPEVLISHYSHLCFRSLSGNGLHKSQIYEKWSDYSELFDQIDTLYSSSDASPLSYSFSPPSVLSVSLTKNSSVPTSFIEQSTSNSHLSLQSLYPIATRYISRNGTFYIERPPFQAQIDYKPAYASSPRKKMPPKTVWIPWTVFAFNPKYPSSSPRMYFSHKSLTSYDDTLLCTYLPNTYPDGKICYSNSLDEIPIESDCFNISSMYAYMINEFFAGAWNADITSSYFNIYSYLVYPLINNNKQDILETIPMFTELFSPSEHRIVESGVLSNNKINNFYKSYNSDPKKFYRLYGDLDSPYFHYILLSILSTFSLKEILDLQEEFSHVINSINSEENSIYKNYSHWSVSQYAHIFKLMDLSSLVLEDSSSYPNYFGLSNFLNSTSINNDFSFDYFDKTFNIILVNSEVSHFTPDLISISDFHKLTSLLTANPSDLFVLDCHTFEIYHYPLTSSFHEEFLKITKSYLDSPNRSFPSSTFFSEASSYVN